METKPKPPATIVKALTNIYPRSGGSQPVGAVFELNDPDEVKSLKRTGQVVEANPEQVAAYRAAQPKGEPDKPASAKHGSSSERSKSPRRQRRKK